MGQSPAPVFKQTCQESVSALYVFYFVKGLHWYIITSATAPRSLEIVSDTILSGKAKVMIAGGFDEEGVLWVHKYYEHHEQC